MQTIFILAEKRLSLMRNQGKDMEDITEAFHDCQNLIKDGDEILQSAKEKFQELQDLEKADQGTQLMTEGLKLLKEARVTYSQAQQDCSKVMKQLRVLK
jgi:exonuclease VII small subunit